MKLLLTNDDGIHAEGLAALEMVVQSIGLPYNVIAPDGPLSGCSHQVTVHRPMKLTSHGERRYSVDGTPADCVRLGLFHVAPDTEFVLSGINDGGNLGIDVYMSGTVAAVREAAVNGRRGIAFSQLRGRPTHVTWQRARQEVERLLRVLLPKDLERGSFWNVNLPDQEDLPAELAHIECPVDYSPLPTAFAPQDDGLKYQGSYHARSRIAGGDVDTCFSGAVSISRLSV